MMYTVLYSGICTNFGLTVHFKLANLYQPTVSYRSGPLFPPAWCHGKKSPDGDRTNCLHTHVKNSYLFWPTTSSLGFCITKIK